MSKESLAIIKRLAQARVDNGMVASRITTRGIEAQTVGVYDKMQRRPGKNTKVVTS